MKPEELSREVNRLYWETDVPVTRLAEQLGVSRGTFYNHLRPLPASGRCSSCKGSLEFRKRSDRENGTAYCASCGQEQPATAARVDRAGSRAARAPRSEVLEVGETPRAQSREASLLAARAAFLSRSDSDDDRLRTQLIFVAVGAAALGLGILYISRRRS